MTGSIWSVGLRSIRPHQAGFHSHTGRPSTGPIGKFTFKPNPCRRRSRPNADEVGGSFAAGIAVRHHSSARHPKRSIAWISAKPP